MRKRFNAKPGDSVSYFGYTVPKYGIAPDPKHIERITTAKSATNNK